MKEALAALLLLWGCGASGPLVAWHGRSPDGLHRVAVVEGDGVQRLIVDGRELGEWEAIGFDHVIWAQSGIAAPVKEDGAWHVFESGTLGPPYEAVGELSATPAGVVYAARDGAGWHVVVDGEPGPPFRSLRAGSLVVRRGRIAYVARGARGEHAVVDGRVGPRHRRVERLSFAGKGERAVYVAYDEDGARIVVDLTPGDIAEAVHELAVSPRVPRWAAIVERNGRLYLDHDGSRAEIPRGARELALSTDGAHVAWVVPSGEGVNVWRDGEPGARHVDIRHLTFVPGGDELLYVAEAVDGHRLVHDSGSSARFDRIEPPVVSASGHWAYVGHRNAGSVLVVDGEVRFRGEWSSSPVLGTTGDGWAAVTRHGARRHVVTARGTTEIQRPFVDTLVVDAEGAHWAIVVAAPSRQLRVVVDGRDVAALEVDEIAAQVTIGRDGLSATRDIVRSELVRATRASGR